MKAVMLSIHPKWCELIASGKKTVEVRRTKPKIDVPFKCYIYETKDKHFENIGVHYADGSKDFIHHIGKVIGEFVCDEITPLFNVATTSWSLLAGNVHEYAKSLVRMARLTEEEMHSYAKRKNCYAWHISDLVIYDEPKELREFYRECERYVCDDCPCLYVENTPNCYETYCEIDGKISIKRPPQSWCYVEKLR